MPGEEGSDYVNASFIDVCDITAYYDVGHYLMRMFSFRDTKTESLLTLHLKVN